MAERLLVLGASVRAAAQSALRAGFEVFGADLFADLDLRQCGPAVAVAHYPDGLAAAAAAMPSCPWMYTGGLENHPDLVAEISRERTLYGNSPEVLQEIRSPLLLREQLARNGLAAPRLSQSPEGIPVDGNWLRKPYRGSGGAAVQAWHGGEHSDANFYQQYMAGEPVAAVYVASRGDAMLLGVTRQLVGTEWTGARGFLYAGSVGPLSLPGPLTEQFVQIGQVLSRRFGLLGLFGVDAVLADGKVWTIEVNPRYTASVEILERALGCRAIALHVQACRGLPLSVSSSPLGKWFGKAILYARRDGTIPEDFGRRASRTRDDLADIPDAGTQVRSGRPVTTVFADAVDEASLMGILQSRVAEVESILYRPDANTPGEHPCTTPAKVV